MSVLPSNLAPMPLDPYFEQVHSWAIHKLKSRLVSPIETVMIAHIDLHVLMTIVTPSSMLLPLLAWALEWDSEPQKFLRDYAGWVEVYTSPAQQRLLEQFQKLASRPGIEVTVYRRYR